MQNSASQKNRKLRNETLPLHKKNVKLHILFVTRPPLARPPLVSAEEPEAMESREELVLRHVTESACIWQLAREEPDQTAS